LSELTGDKPMEKDEVVESFLEIDSDGDGEISFEGIFSLNSSLLFLISTQRSYHILALIPLAAQLYNLLLFNPHFFCAL